MKILNVTKQFEESNFGGVEKLLDDLCLEFPNENIKYAEVSCLDKIYTDEKLKNLNTCNNKINTFYNCATCAKSSDVHYAITTFLQFAYDSAIKPHYYNLNAIAEIGCAGINGTSRFFKLKKEEKEDLKNCHSSSFYSSIKTPRKCCGEHYYSYSSHLLSSPSSPSSPSPFLKAKDYSGCSSCTIL